MICRPTASPLRSNLVTGRSAQRSTGHPPAAARRRAPSASGRRSPAQSVASRHIRPGRSREAASAANSGVDQPALVVARAWATGRGRTSRAPRPRRARTGARGTTRRRRESSRTFAAPASASRPSVCATPGRHTSSATMSYDGRCAASTAVASPTPEPISTISGAVTTEHLAPAERRVVDRLVGDHPVAVVGVPRLLLRRGEPPAAPGVAEHLPHPPPVLGVPLPRVRRGKGVVHAAIVSDGGGRVAGSSL